ncbi:hypothetical protein ABMA28_003468 [Loxostege sticticalis]|uniref:Regulatory protein zeste n=1 Tax=Loxostege sticticalis TaxID=481309 RepID=A0ABD0SWL4_LOXSC
MSAPPTAEQIEMLLNFLQEHQDLARGHLRDASGRAQRSRRQWEELAVRLNSLGGTIKNYKQWTKYWSDKKSAIKKVAARSAARRRTGGGVEDVVELSELEERIVALCGGEGFSTGDTHLGIQPFPLRSGPMSCSSSAWRRFRTPSRLKTRSASSAANSRGLPPSAQVQPRRRTSTGSWRVPEPFLLSENPSLGL